MNNSHILIINIKKKKKGYIKKFIIKNIKKKIIRNNIFKYNYYK